jgi:hypothetical protein
MPSEHSLSLHHEWRWISTRFSLQQFSPCQHVAALVVLVLLVAWPQGGGAQTLFFEDTLLGATTGTRAGGLLQGDGWRVTDQYDSIFWHIPTTSHGAVEWDVRGLNPNESRPTLGDASELFHMYDYTYVNSDFNYDPGFRDNPYKHTVRKQGNLDLAPNRMKMVYKIGEPFYEDGTSSLSWNSNTTYRFREEWGPDGFGNSVITLYRNSQQLLSASLPGTYAPVGHSIRIGASTRRAAESGAPIDAVFSNVRVWDLSDVDPPDPPDPRAGLVSLNDHSLHDDDGDFLGLGATYMQALRRTKFDRERYRSDLATLSSKGFNYIRTLSMVGWYDFWEGREIAPITFQNENGTTVQGWNDYWQQYRDMIDIAYDEFGLRTQVTIFADAQLKPSEADRINHMQMVLDNLVGREEKVILLEVANEAWQNGFPGSGGTTQVREFGQYLADRTDIPVALSSPLDGSNSGIEAYYQGSAADIATVHFERDTGTIEGGWLPVRDSWRMNQLTGVPPGSSNEPIGPGSSVDTETDPIKLVTAAAYAWMAGLPMYVYHTSAGVRGLQTFESMAGIDDYLHLAKILPGDIANWQRYTGKEAAAPFITYANGQPNKWWTEVASPTSGVVDHIGNVNGNRFYTLPIGILGGGVELEAKEDMTIQVFNPLNGEVVHAATPSSGERFTLVQGPGAYIVKGLHPDVVQRKIDLGKINAPDGILHPVAGDGITVAKTIGNREARRNENPNQDFYFYFAVADWFAFEGDQQEVAITIDYFDSGEGTLALQYDSSDGDSLADFYKPGGQIPLTGTDTWLQHTFILSDAYFGNRQNFEADFRIYGGLGNVFYLDTVRVTPGSNPLPGDYNGNWVVDAADYVVWRDSLGQTGPALAADGDRNGSIEQADYVVWKMNFGNTVGGGSSSDIVVPEPASWLLIMVSTAVGIIRRCLWFC